jgi:hypothetical protein
VLLILTLLDKNIVTHSSLGLRTYVLIHVKRVTVRLYDQLLQKNGTWVLSSDCVARSILTGVKGV